MSDGQLKLDSDALDSFTLQLKRLMDEGSVTFLPASFAGGIGHSDVENVLSDMANTDVRIGERLHAYLSALADLTEASAEATRDLDQKLAADVPSHTRLKELY